jgi:hypothetical protein
LEEWRFYRQEGNTRSCKVDFILHERYNDGMSERRLGRGLLFTGLTALGLVNSLSVDAQGSNTQCSSQKNFTVEKNKIRVHPVDGCTTLIQSTGMQIFEKSNRIYNGNIKTVTLAGIGSGLGKQYEVTYDPDDANTEYKSLPNGEVFKILRDKEALESKVRYAYPKKDIEVVALGDNALCNDSLKDLPMPNDFEVIFNGFTKFDYSLWCKQNKKK